MSTQALPMTIPQMGTRLICALASALLLVAGCSTAPSNSPPATSPSASTGQPSEPFTLAETSWQLVSIRDGHGAKTFSHPSPYTVTFGADGQAQFRIDCNSGNATWEAKPNPPDPNWEASGSLKFGPISTTKMMCPHPSDDERVKNDLGLVFNYIIKDQEDGRLHMDLPYEGSLGWDQA